MKREITRRRWLVGAGAMLGAPALATLARGEGVPGPQPEYGGLPMGIQSYSLRHLGLDEALDAVAGLGLHHVELYGNHLSPAASGAEIELALAKLRRRDIALSAHGVNRFSADHAANRRLFEFANRAGIRNLSADPEPDDATFDSLERLVDEFGVRIAIHNHATPHPWARPETTAEAIDGRHRRIGVCADLGHFIRSGVDPLAALRVFEGRLYGVHLKDFATAELRARPTVIGAGRLDLIGVFRTLATLDFPADGALSLEHEVRDPMDDIRACLAAASRAAGQAA